MNTASVITRCAALLACVSMLSGCWPASTPESRRPPRAEKWYRRALKEYRRVAMDAAYDSARQALDIVPNDPEVKLFTARVALARLEFDEALKQLKGVQGTTASSLRGRAYWYKGELELAANELDRMLADPDVNDPWAKEITKLARRGAGRKPFEIHASVGSVAPVKMARISPLAPYYVVPLEMDGEKALALIATGTPEVMVDSKTRKESSWISLRFAKRLEVKDVPALTRDLTGVSRQVGAPIKVLLGVSLLRHLNVTLDHRGRQFVARAFIPYPPPGSSRLDVFYLRGGGMIVGAPIGTSGGDIASLLIDTSLGHAVALTAEGFAKAGVSLDSLQILGPPNAKGPKLRGGPVPLLRFGTFDLAQVQAIHGTDLEKLEKDINIDIDGALGAGLLFDYRLTLTDGGRTLWIEQPPTVKPAVPIGPPPPPNAPKKKKAAPAEDGTRAPATTTATPETPAPKEKP